MSAVTLGAFCWLLFAAALSTRRFVRAGGGSIHLVVVAHFLLCGLPLALDALFGEPIYQYSPGVRFAMADPSTTLCFALYASLCPVVWWWTGVPREVHRVELGTLQVGPIAARLRTTGVLLACLPFALVVLAPDPSAYFTYASVVRGRIGDSGREWHSVVSSAALVGVLGTSIALSTYRKIGAATWAVGVVSIFGSCWIYGKRTLVAVAVVALGYIFWQQGILRGRRLYVWTVSAGVALLAFSFYYQERIRFSDDPFLGAERAAGYEQFRTDFFRDDRIRMSLFAELHPSQLQILEYRGQSVLYNLVFLVPRGLWEEKPWPYAVYFTSAMLNIVPPRPLGWATTTNWLDEAVANFGWLGILVGPLALALICRLGDAAGWAALNVLTALVGVLMLAVQLSAFMGVFLLWLLLLLMLWPSTVSRTRFEDSPAT